jgi:hypothetical protein
MSSQSNDPRVRLDQLGISDGGEIDSRAKAAAADVRKDLIHARAPELSTSQPNRRRFAIAGAGVLVAATLLAVTAITLTRNPPPDLGAQSSGRIGFTYAPDLLKIGALPIGTSWFSP